MRIAYITAHTPYGRGETFVLDEMLTVAELGVDVIVVPRNPPKEIFHKEAERILDRTIRLPLINLRILLHFIWSFFVCHRLWKLLWMVFTRSRSVKILVKNLTVLPKAVFLARLLKDRMVTHIHAHWGSTTSTMAWVISQLTGIPWSFTLHRWDIAENNMLKLKIRQASFARCISQDGRDELLQIVGTEYSDKVKVLHLGVRMPKRLSSESTKLRSEFVIICPANLVLKKGHRFLIEACKLLRDEGFSDFRCLIIGDGPLEGEIRQQIARYKLNGIVHLTGRLPHEVLMGMYERNEVDVVVLPSIITESGEKEGIPVALMEAMAYGIPVISTSTGGIPELLHDGAGILVPPRSPEALAKAIRELMLNKALKEELGRRGRARVETEFNLRENVSKLICYMKFDKSEK